MSPNKEVSLRNAMMIDFEASGLGPDSWPIEVGLSWYGGERVEIWSSLIRPSPDWDMEQWSVHAEEIHGISILDLSRAPSAWDVADELIQRCSGRLLFSDAPEYDQFWMDRLLSQTSQNSHLIIDDFDFAAAAICGETGVNWAYERLERKAQHRAGPDAERLMQAILFGVEKRS